MADTEKFKKEFREYLRVLGARPHTPQEQYTIDEFRQWTREDVVPFSKRPAKEQLYGKIEYEKSIGNTDRVLVACFKWFEIWLANNETNADPDYYLYHGTTEVNSYLIMLQGIKRGKAGQSQWKKAVKSKDLNAEKFQDDVSGVVCLSTTYGDALFFSAVAVSAEGEGRQAIIIVDSRKLNPNLIERRDMFNRGGVEVRYHGDVPTSAIIGVKVKK